MTSGLEDAVAMVLGDWLSDPLKDQARKGLILLHNYPRIASETDVHKIILEGWNTRMQNTSAILSEHGYESAGNWAGNLSALGGIAGAFVDGVVGAGLGCLLGLFIPYAIADVNHYSIKVKTRWMYVALTMADPKELTDAIKYAVRVHHERLAGITKKALVKNHRWP